MTWALLLIATVLTCELFVRLPLLRSLQRVLRTATRARHVLGSRAISDHWKEFAARRYASRLASSSLTIFVLLLIAFLPFVAFGLLGQLVGAPFAELAASWPGIATATVLALGYLSIRGRRRGGGAASVGADYSLLDRTLHALVLSSASRGEMLFDLESASAPKPPPGAEAGRHVFVVGLARAGTTVLMRAIHESGAYASLTYRDMPFVMAPNLWARLSGSAPKHMEKTERAHGDAVDVDYDSPEALEEPFWRTFCGSDYIRSDALVPHVVDAEIIEHYRSFVGHVLARYRATQYIAKNNNSVLRLPALASAFPHAIILAPFRAPLDQAQSLLRQHRRFQDDETAFTARYMSWLAHHEFGRDHRPFVIDGERPRGNIDSVDYWLSMWVIVYAQMLHQLDVGAALLTPVAYEDYCGEDRSVWRAVCRLISIPETAPDFRARASGAPAPVDAALLSRATGIYERLRAYSQARLADPTPTAQLPRTS